MRTIIKCLLSLLLMILVLGGTSCNKLLEVETKGVITSATFWQNKSQAIASIAGMYASLSVSNPNFAVGATGVTALSNVYLTPQEAYLYWGDIRGETLGTNPTKMPANQLSKENVDAYLTTAADPTTRFGAFYRIINQANLAIERIPAIKQLDPNFTDQDVKELIGEAYFIRAFCYFWLVRTFKDVPLILTANTRDDQPSNIPKSVSSEILNQIVKDLTQARTQLPEWYTNTLYPRVRATKYTALTVLSDVYLWQAAMSKDQTTAMQLYDKVIDHCDTILNSGRFFLMPGAQYTTIASPGNTGESIFEQYTNNTLNNQTSSMNGWFQFSQLWIVTLSTDGLFSGTPVSDYRANTTSTTQGYNVTTRVLQKYTSNNARWIFYRLAEVYFMQAEALAHRYPNDAARLAQACDLVNAVRQRAYYPVPAQWPVATATTTADMDEILLDERAREFIGEGRRWFELMRFASRDNFAHKEYLINRALRAASGTDQLKISPRVSNPDSWYLPLNSDELSANPALVQNPYYN